MYVVDASVVLKWFLEENDSNKAVELYEQAVQGVIEFAAPDILLYEVVNILIRKKKASIGQAKRAVRLLFGTGIELSQPDPGLLSQAIEIAAGTGVSAYDASYVALANALGWELVTADRRLAALAESRAKVRMLDTF